MLIGLITDEGDIPAITPHYRVQSGPQRTLTVFVTLKVVASRQPQHRSLIQDNTPSHLCWRNDAGLQDLEQLSNRSYYHTQHRSNEENSVESYTSLSVVLIHRRIYRYLTCVPSAPPHPQKLLSSGYIPALGWALIHSQYFPHETCADDLRSTSAQQISVSILAHIGNGSRGVLTIPEVAPLA